MPVALLTTMVLAPEEPVAVGDAELAVIKDTNAPDGTLVETTCCPTATKLFGEIVMTALALVVEIDAVKITSSSLSVAPALMG